MSILDFLTSTKRPEAGTPVLPAGEVRQRLLALNRPGAPFQIVDGSAEGVDLIAQWKIIDANWFGIFFQSRDKKGVPHLPQARRNESRAAGDGPRV